MLKFTCLGRFIFEFGPRDRCQRLWRRGNMPRHHRQYIVATTGRQGLGGVAAQRGVTMNLDAEFKLEAPC
jgi:hypothetical protein